MSKHHHEHESKTILPPAMTAPDPSNMAARIATIALAEALANVAARQTIESNAVAHHAAIKLASLILDPDRAPPSRAERELAELVLRDSK